MAAVAGRLQVRVATGRELPGRGCLLLLLRHRRDSGHGSEVRRPGLPVRRGDRGFQGQGAGWRQDLPAASGTRCAREGLLVGHRVRQPDPLHAPDRPGLSPGQQSGQGVGDQCGWFGGRLLRPEASCGHGRQLDPDPPRQGLEHALPALWPARAVVRQDLEAQRDRGSESSGGDVHVGGGEVQDVHRHSARHRDPGQGGNTSRHAEFLRRLPGRCHRREALRQSRLPARRAGLSAGHPRGESGRDAQGPPAMGAGQHDHADLGGSGLSPHGWPDLQHQHPLRLDVDRPPRWPPGGRSAAGRARRLQRPLVPVGGGRRRDGARQGQGRQVSDSPAALRGRGSRRILRRASPGLRDVPGLSHLPRQDGQPEAARRADQGTDEGLPALAGGQPAADEVREHLPRTVRDGGAGRLPVLGPAQRRGPVRAAVTPAIR